MTTRPDTLDLSLNEVENLAQKAARGAGLPWGVAEDTGRAAAWIARRIGVWAGPLLALLEVPPPREQSPLLLAGLLADSDKNMAFEAIVAPLWALPGLLSSARRPVSIHLDDIEIRAMPGEAATASVPPGALGTHPAASISVRLGVEIPLQHVMSPRFSRAETALAEYRRFEILASRTYVSPTDRSRRSGAGAGLLDDE